MYIVFSIKWKIQIGCKQGFKHNEFCYILSTIFFQVYQLNIKITHSHYIHIYQSMVVQKLLKSIRTLLPLNTSQSQPSPYTPTFFLNHHVLQSVYELASPQIPIQFNRQKIYFEDGGHISLDWANETFADEGRPIVFIMHGMTGGSQTKYIKALVQKAEENGYCSVCLNSRGINSEMTSPIPFVGIQFHEIQSALNHIRIHYPHNPLYLIGTSLGGNYVLRYLLSSQPHTINGLALISPPFDVKYVINCMNQLYQKMFIKYYMNNTVMRHPQMKFWWDSGLVDLQLLKEATNLRQFHDRITVQIMGYTNSDDMFDQYKIHNHCIEDFPIKTLILTAKDDPMVSFTTFPVDSINKNKNIKFIATETGGHICWFEGVKPRRWYPTPVFQFFNDIQNSRRNKSGLIV